VPLIDCAESVLVVIDFQPGFMAAGSMTDPEKAEAQATRTRALWLAAAATLFDVPATVVEEGPERAGQTDAELIDRLAPQTAVHVEQTFGIASQAEAIAVANSASPNLAAIRSRDRI